MKSFIKPHWILLFLYFLVSSTILLSTTAHHHTFDLTYVLIASPFVLLFVAPSKLRGITGLGVILLVLFTVLHAAPFIPMMQSHHQSIAHDMHPCCMPQLSDASVGQVDEPFFVLVSNVIERKEDIHVESYFGLRTTRAPPAIS